MNLKINTEQANYLTTSKMINYYLIGSELYGTANVNSDIDYLVVIKPLDNYAELGVDTHLFQYDKVKDTNIEGDRDEQYMYITERQMWRNLIYGESSIFSDLVLFSDKFNRDYDLNIKSKLELTQTFKTIRCYIGMAKRDIKYIKKSKNGIFHVARGLYMANSLMDGNIPTISDIQTLSKEFQKNKLNSFWLNHLKEQEKITRLRCNEMHQTEELKTMSTYDFYKLDDNKINDSLVRMLKNSRNQHIFKY